MPGGGQPVQRRHGEIGRSHEGNAHGFSQALGKAERKPISMHPMASPEIDALTQALARLPGLGPRSARRAVLHLLKRRETALTPLLRALELVNERLSTCHVCGNVDTSDPCSICADPRRDERSLCVVEEVADLWALERSRLFPGRFHSWAGVSLHSTAYDRRI
jgi:recombinational DNA repair protein RecR